MVELEMCYYRPRAATNVFFFFTSAKSDLPGQPNAGNRCKWSVDVLVEAPEGDEQGGEKCQGGGPVTQQTSELTPSQLHRYLNRPLPYDR